MNNIFADAAMYMKIGVKIFNGSSGATVLRVEKLSRGRISGGIGTTRTRLTLRSLRREIEEQFTELALLIAVSEGWEESDRMTKY